MADESRDQQLPAEPILDAPASETTEAQAAAPAPVEDVKMADDNIKPAHLPTIDDLIAGPGAAASTGTSTPMQLDPEQAMVSLKVSLADLSAKATRLYAQRSYEEAVEMFSAAAQMQAEMNGDMNPDNAEILFLYGRALFKVGQSKSDVLGGKAPEVKKQPKAKKNGAVANGGAKKTNGSAPAEKKEVADEPVEAGGEADKTEDTAEATEKAEKTLAEAAAEKPGSKADESGEKKPLFQFEGDENFDEPEEDEDAEGDGEEAEEDEDDLAVAFEILDLARVLLNKKMEDLTNETAETEGKGKEVADGDSPSIKHIKERLADTHDLLAEISLENERYPNAITDFRASLALKEELFPQESELIAEAHFKLSLALEFASITTSSDDAKDGGGAKEIDDGLREEAVKHLEAAVASTKLKLQNKEVELATLHNPEDNEVTRKEIAETKDILGEMEVRLVELKNSPVDVNEALGGGLGAIFGSAMGDAAAAQNSARLEEATKNAKDLSGLVRKKRKAEDEPIEAEEVKKAKTDDGEPEAAAATAE